MQFKTLHIRWEIFGALLLKIVLLFLLWKICFSHPHSHTVTGTATTQHVLSSHIQGDHHGY